MNRIEDTLNTLRDIALPASARSRMREELIAYAELHAVAAMPPRAVRSPLRAFRFRVYAGLSAAVLLIAALGGTAYASESALPGDALYSVKVGFAEPLQTALVPSDRGKAAWHAILAERRLDETAQLAARGSLSSSDQTELAANFNAQVSASEQSADRLQHDGDTGGSLSARADLEARLAAHEQILSVIAAHYATATSTDGEETHAALQDMLALVTGHEQAVTSSRIALENAIAPDGAADDGASDATTTADDAKIAVATSRSHPAALHLTIHEPAAAQVETAAVVRTTEEQDILERHAPFLAKFLPIASSTATSTATTTASTTVATTTDTDADTQAGDGLEDSSTTLQEDMNW